MKRETRQPRRLLIVHGHFYQPPREDPWTGLLEHQDSASPQHDWNERITFQCYAPNTRSRIMSGSGHIERLANNFETICFDVGPTLLAWLEKTCPRVVDRIVEADRASRRRLEGCGNAMAQAYGHLILPLADETDKVTQIAWGLAEFRHRFGHDSAGLWLPEAAIDRITADRVIEAGIKFVILSPFQAKAIRPLAGGEWQDVTPGVPDVSRPYLLRHSNAPADARTLAVFFYDAALSKAIAFEGLLRDAGTFVDRISRSFEPIAGRDGCVTIATDGESYGHHELHGDMALAAMMRLKLDGRHIEAVNPELAMRLIPPTHEVVLKEGDGGLGTAWSCAHGVGRWMRDCGCSAGSRPGWNQRWREPLRHGLDVLSRELKRIFETVTSAHFRDPWAARNRYIDVILAGHSKAARDRFFADTLKTDIDATTRVTLLEMLESQRFGMAMFTSCGWFFDDIGGIEPIQNLRYAARAIELAQPHAKGDLKDLLLPHLKKARSNEQARGHGASLFLGIACRPGGPAHRQAARSLMVRAAGARDLAPALVSDSLEPGSDEPSCDRAGRGVITLTSEVTEAVDAFHYSVEPVAPVGLDVEVTERSPGGTTERFSWAGLDHDLKTRLAQASLAARLGDVDVLYRRIFEDGLAAIRALRAAGLGLPPGYAVAVRRALESALEEIARQLQAASGAAGTADRAALAARIRETFCLASDLIGCRPGEGLTVSSRLVRELSDAFTGLLGDLDRAIEKGESDAARIDALIDEAWEMLDLDREFRLELDLWEAENAVSELLTARVQAWIDRLLASRRPVPPSVRDRVYRVVELGARLNFVVPGLADDLARLGTRHP